MDNKELRKAIRKILYEGLEDSEMWSDVDTQEMMGNAERAAREDMEKSGEKFEPLGKSQFEKNIDVDAMLADLENQKHAKHGASLQRIQKQIDQLKRFGGGSLNELSPEVRNSALKKSIDYIEQPGDTFQKDPLQYIKRKNQANTFITHINPELKTEAMGIAKMLGENYESRIEKEAIGGSYEPVVVLVFGKNIADINNNILKIVIKKNSHTWNAKIHIPENIQRRIANFIKKIQAKEISTPIRINEAPELNKPKDANGKSISSGVRVEYLKTGNAGRVERFGIDDKTGKLTVHVAWTTKYGQEAPKSVVYPKDIIVKDAAKKMTDEGIGTSLSMKKGMNIKEENIDEDSLEFRHIAGQREKSRKGVPLGKHAPHSQVALKGEGTGIGLAVKKGMNVKPTHGK